jgi:uncharacterized membrane protein
MKKPAELKTERKTTMTQMMIALSIWLHSLATVILIGHYLLLALIYLPAFEKKQANPVSGMILSEISKCNRVWMYTSLGVFIVTGIYLMLANLNYLGVGDFSNIWSILMLVKHVLIVGMLGAGFWYNAILRVGPQMISNTGSAQAFVRFRQYSVQMAIAGVSVLLLTAISQAL